MHRNVFALAVCALSLVSNSCSHSDAAETLAPIERLAQGNERFRSGRLRFVQDVTTRRENLAKGQHPFAVVVGCADSRVAPEIVFDQGLGDLFVVRVAGNVLSDPDLGSIEYAVEHLGAKLVVVLGHERCGAVKAVLDGGHLGAHLASFTPSIAPAVAQARQQEGDLLDNAVRANLRRIVDKLQHCEPLLAEHAHFGLVEIVGARYDLDTGVVEFLDDAGTTTTRELPAHSDAQQH
jgi:carbonic anhydrase